MNERSLGEALYDVHRKGMRIYLAGPMRGIEEFNFPTFHATAQALREKGHTVFSPAERDIDRHGFDISKGQSGDLAKLSADTGFDIRVALREDLGWICENAEAVALLPGWEHSKGATAEAATARAIGIEALPIDNFLPGWCCSHPTREELLRMQGVPVMAIPAGTVFPTDMQPGHIVCSERLVPRYEDLPGANGKPSNPKDALGIRKAPLSTIPAPVMLEVGLAMLEGALKYGRHNYRVIGVRASVYFDALMRHAMAWWEGEDLDPDSGLSHITKAIASLVVLRDAMIQGKMVDDRPPRTHDISHFMKRLNGQVVALLEKYPEPVAPYTEVSQR